MSAQITLNWEKDLTFETLLDGHKVTIDRDMEDAAKIDKAIRLSQEKYCGVGLMMKKIAPITYEILLNGEPLKPYPNDK